MLNHFINSRWVDELSNEHNNLIKSKVLEEREIVYLVFRQ